jgi:hypothetical protein
VALYAIAVGGDGVYVGGLSAPPAACGQQRRRWNSTTGTWSALSSGLSNGVSSYAYAIAISGNDVYVGGLSLGLVVSAVYPHSTLPME